MLQVAGQMFEVHIKVGYVVVVLGDDVLESDSGCLHGQYTIKMLRLRRMLQHMSDTIFAASTNVAKAAAVNIVRISGPEAYKCLRMLYKGREAELKGREDSEKEAEKQQLIERFGIRPRYACNRTLYDIDDGSVIDKILLLYFPEGKSYNGEDIFELHLHGSRAILKHLYRKLSQLGFRIAEPGEFTKRALVNNKMDVLEVEGLHELIQSENEFSRRLAMNQVLGETSRYLESIKKELVSCLASCEAFIDFQDDEMDVKADIFDNTKIRASKVAEEIRQCLGNKQQVETLSNGVNVVILGRPNAGKSTILNKLAKREVSIVSDEPGTTRDVIETTLEYKGVSLNVSDTAGIRDTQHKVEKEGIRRALEKTKYSHINLLIVDISNEEVISTPQEAKILLKGQIDPEVFSSPKTMIVANKMDLVALQTTGPILVVSGDIEREVTLGVSALHDNIDRILDHVLLQSKQMYNLQQNAQHIFLSRERHFRHLEQGLQHLQCYLSSGQVDVAAEELRLCIREVGKILGRVDCEEVLDVLFRDFCIGK